MNLPQVQRLLGHQTITTTVRYLHIADPQRHAAVQLHPINQMLAATPTEIAVAAAPASAGGQP